MSAAHGSETPSPETRNFSRYCVENPHITWVLLIGTIIWGAYGYTHMPQRKDPDIPVKQAMIVTPWPGASADKIEDLVTRTIEQTVASNTQVARIESVSRSNASFVTFTLSDDLKETGQILDDIGGRLAAIRDLPSGAGPIDYVRDFGDTASLMLTVASPKADSTEVDIRAGGIRKAIEAIRPPGRSAGRASLVYCFPATIDSRAIRPAVMQFIQYIQAQSAARDVRSLEGPGFFGIDGETTESDARILGFLHQFLTEHYRADEQHPDLWPPVVIRDPAETRAKLAAVAADKYSYHELDDFTDAIEKALLATGRTSDGTPLVAKVTRSGLVSEKVYLLYSQERLASYGVKPDALPRVLAARNIDIGAAEFDAGGKRVSVKPSGEFQSEEEIRDVVIGATPYGTPLYLRDVADVMRAYDRPARYLNFYSWRDAQGVWQRTRAVTVAAQMGSGQQIARFGEAVDATLDELRTRLPKDLIIARTSDQPRQVEENIHLFMTSLYEAIALVVVVSLIGFWEWRSALLMALSIPLTLLMTAGMMHLLGIDLQQVSIASLIIALGLLVDDPVVAGDAIKREMAAGQPRSIAAWLGPTKLATAILYATITNIVAYLPFLILGGTTGQFLYSLPVVMGCSLVASRIVSMSFIPFLGHYLLRARQEPSIEERRTHGFAAAYYRVGWWAIQHRWLVLAGSCSVLALGGYIGSALKQQFFPKDLAQLAFINVYLPEDAPFLLTDQATRQVERIVQEVSASEKRPLESVTSFVGGSAPRFWYSAAPEPQRPNFAQVVLLFVSKLDTAAALPLMQERISREIAGAYIDVRQLETGDSVGLPVAIRVSGEDVNTLRATAESLRQVLTASPLAARPRDDWGEHRFNVDLQIDPDRANLAGITNYDVAGASATGINGYSVTTLREGDKQIPVVARLRPYERATLEDVNNLYVYSRSGDQKIPLRQVSRLDYSFQNEVLRRRNQFRAITVSAAPREGVLASEVMNDVRPKVQSIAASLPPGYRLEIAGEEEKQREGFANLVVVLIISIVAIYVALTFQFRNAIKPFIVFAAVPYGAVGALTALWIMGAPFGFMGFLGVVSLVGVIVSHIIVLFDFIEEKHAEGEPFERAVLDAGIMRLRPVMITVGATVIALFPLAAHGGPLWEPMCYAQIGGLTAATFITLLLVPVFYAICVLDFKIVKWSEPK